MDKRSNITFTDTQVSLMKKILTRMNFETTTEHYEILGGFLFYITDSRKRTLVSFPFRPASNAEVERNVAYFIFLCTTKKHFYPFLSLEEIYCRTSRHSDSAIAKLSFGGIVSVLTKQFNVGMCGCDSMVQFDYDVRSETLNYGANGYVFNSLV